ncbi:unnamed protein product, partial [marine sediment metagenome]
MGVLFRSRLGGHSRLHSSSEQCIVVGFVLQGYSLFHLGNVLH